MTTFTVPGRIVPWKRAQRSASGHTYTAADRAAYRRVVQAAARAAGVPLLTGAVSLDVRVYVPDARRWDWDNGGKIVSDAINGIAYLDDSQIRDGRVRSYPVDARGPIVVVEVLDVTGIFEPLGKPNRTRAKKSDALPDARASKRRTT